VGRDFLNEVGSFDGSGVEGHLVSTGGEQPARVTKRAHTASHRERDEEATRDAIYGVH
jgi:hypothetical protein